jgi:hypothetical protein
MEFDSHLDVTRRALDRFLIPASGPRRSLPGSAGAAANRQRRTEGFKRLLAELQDMSQATKLVLLAIGFTAVLAVAQILGAALA